MPDVELKRESWASFWPEAKLLARQEWEEYRGVLQLTQEFCLDTTRMGLLYEQGLLHIYTARVNGAIAGYLLWVLDWDLEVSKSTLRQGPWYVGRRFRASVSGLRLFENSLRELREKYPDISSLDLHCPPFGRGKRLELLFKRLGAKPVATHFRLDLATTEPLHA